MGWLGEISRYLRQWFLVRSAGALADPAAVRTTSARRRRTIDSTADGEGMDRDAKIRKQPSTTHEEKQRNTERDNHRSPQSLTLFDISQLAGQSDKTGRHPERIDDYHECYKRLQTELQEILIHV